MTRMMRTTVLQSIKIFLFFELLVVATSLYSYLLFLNVQVAFASSFFIIIGSAYAYKKMVSSKADSGEYAEERDLLDKIEDPHELYVHEKPEEQSEEVLDFKEIVKEEKAKIKTLSLKNMKYGARGSLSLFRVVPYIFLILGFIALKNNAVLELKFYLPSLILGIIAGALLSKRLS